MALRRAELEQEHVGVLVDTADTYSDGASEAVLGDWMRHRKNRDQIVVSTKCGNHPSFEGLSATTVAAAAEASPALPTQSTITS